MVPTTVLVHAKDQKIGDAFLQVPFFQSARARFPDAHITLVVSLGKTAYASSLASVMAPYIDEIIEEAHLCDDWRQIFARPRPLNNRRFDLVIDMQKGWWRTLAVRRIRHRLFISAARHYLFSDRRPPLPLKPPHLREQFLKLLDATARPERCTPRRPVWWGEAERAAAAACLPEGGRVVGLVPGAGEHFKRWPLERYIELARAQGAKGRRVAFILGPDEKDWVDVIRRDLPDVLLPGWLGPGSKAGGLTPLEVTALGAQLAAVVTNDCGTAHILAASGVPMVSLFGATNPTKYAPDTPTLRVVQSANAGAAAMELISVDHVLEVLESLLQGAAPAPRAMAPA